MRNFNIKIIACTLVAGTTLFLSSCVKDLLDQPATTQVDASIFWKTESDATIALMGAYADVRPLFNMDYMFDGHGEYVRARGEAVSTTDVRLGDAYDNANWNPSGYAGAFDKMYRHLYGGVNRTNYVVQNVTNMLSNADAASVPGLEAIIGEARLLRALVYFKLISMWGHVPYFSEIITDNEQVAHIERTHIEQVKDKILEDLTYAFEKLPESPAAVGRVGKPAALALRGKVQLYWACWNKNGWPELSEFTPNAGKAQAAFEAAANDFRSVINDFDLTLFRNGEPGEIDALGKADVLPNYYYLFTPLANGSSEIILGFTHGGVGTGQGEELMRYFAGRSHEGSQCWVSPRYAIANRYQLISTGDFAPPLVPMNPTVPAADNVARTTENSAVNPQSYAGRDYRMKSTILWDYETSMGFASRLATGWVPFIYNQWNAPITIDGVDYLTYNTDGCNTGYVFRKFVRNYDGQGRSEGDYQWPVIRLADVYLMYAEAVNELPGRPGLELAIEVVNKVRHRGNLPPLDAAKTADYQPFFDAIEQERIVELIAEGQRGFDLRRWRAIERIWGAPGGPGVRTIDSWGTNRDLYYQNVQERTYQQNYIFRIPTGERDRNPNLTQNTPWL